MNFDDIPGLPHLKNHLKTTVERGRIAHAQLFVGEHGYGTLPTAIAFASEIVSRNLSGEAKRICRKKIEALNHPDLHFVYPVNTNEEIKSNPVAKDFYLHWRKFVSEQPYGELYHWLKELGIEKKQGNINVREAAEISKAIALKSYEGAAKIMIIWCADKMNTAASNKLLKLIEEPPKDTYFILITNAEEQLLETIKSRCQKINFPPLSEEQIAQHLQNKHQLSKEQALPIAAQADGNLSKALELLDQNSDNQVFEKLFIAWVRTAFRAKGNKSVVQDLSQWAQTLAKENRETQTRFINFSIQFFRQALLQNYKAKPLVFMKTYDEQFKFDKFASFIHGGNIEPIFNALQEAHFHIQRNANAKIVFTDLSMQLTRYIHKK
ncbi:MAG: DNA polymerase III subunit delta' [Psychroflexus maritimus]